MSWTKQAEDSFTDGYGVAITSHTPDMGSAWVIESGTWNIYNTYLDSVSGGVGTVLRNSTTLADKQACDSILDGHDARTNPCVRLQAGSASGYGVEYRGNYPLLTLYRIDSGSLTQLAQTSDSGSSTCTLRIEADGSTLSVYIDGVLKITHTDATYSSGYAGLFVAMGGACNSDKFTAYDDSGGGGGVSGSASITLDALTCSATATLAIAGTATNTLAALTLSAAGTLALQATASITLGSLSLSSTGSLAVAGAASVTLAALTLTGAGTLAIAGSAGITLGDLTLAGTGTIAIAGAASVTLGSLTLASTGTLALAGAAAIVLDPVTLVATGTGQTLTPITGTLDVTLDPLTLVSTGVHSSPPPPPPSAPTGDWTPPAASGAPWSTSIASTDSWTPPPASGNPW